MRERTKADNLLSDLGMGTTPLDLADVARRWKIDRAAERGVSFGRLFVGVRPRSIVF